MQSRITSQHPLARGRNIIWALAACLALLLLWRAAPGLDIFISSLFFEPFKCGDAKGVGGSCGHFPASFDPTLRTMRVIGLRLPHLVILVVIVLGIANLVRGYNPSLRFWQAPVVALLSIALGPIAVINFVFKTHIGRARPFQLEMFGSKEPFTLPASLADNCVFNCSFPSGEAAAATWLLFIIPFLPKPLRWPIGIAIVLFVIAVSALRVAMGRHFASDVTMGIAFSLLFLAVAFWLAARVPQNWHLWRGTRSNEN